MSTFLTAIAWGFGTTTGIGLGLIFITALKALIRMPLEFTRRKRLARKEKSHQTKANALLLENSDVFDVVSELTALKERPNQRGTGHTRNLLLRRLRKLVPDREVRAAYHKQTR